MNSLLLLTSLLCILGSEAFFTLKPSSGALKSTPQTDEAISAFAEKYPFNRPPVADNPFKTFGMPGRDFDGTEIIKYREKDPANIGKRLTDIPESQAKSAFNILAKLYGADEALEMVKALPIILAFNQKNFERCLKEWTEIFGEEESKAMILRNPGLLAVNPEEAAKATDQTMTFSYIVAATRPIGPVALPLLLALLLTPAFEAVTGIPIRATFISSLTGVDSVTVANTMNQIAKPIWQQL